MSEIRYIKNRSDWNATIEKNKYLVVNFTASWCGPCRAIKPFVDELYKKPEYKKVEFVRVDTDTVPDVCQEHSVSSIPTFVLFEMKKEVDRVTNDFPSKLTEAVKQLSSKANSDVSAEERSSSGLAATPEEIQQYVPPGFEVLNSTINFGDSVALNFMPLSKNNTDVKNFLRQNSKEPSVAYTDADSQGLLFILFNNISKVHSILLKFAKPESSEGLNLDGDEIENETQSPSLIKVWPNIPSILSFDEASSDASAQSVTKIDPNETAGWHEVKLKYVRFQSVQTLNIFIDGQDEDSHTIIEKVIFIGVSGNQAKSQHINYED